MLQKPSQCSRSCFLSMVSLRPSDLTMDHNLPTINSLSLLRSGTLITPTSSSRNPRGNGQAKAAVKITKGLLTCAKYSGQDPYLALLAYRSTPIDAHLSSPAEMLYQRAIRTTVPQRIRHKDPQAAADWDHLNDCATQSAAYHDHHCSPPLYAGQTVSVLNDTKTLWFPATVICQARHGSYLVQVIGRGQYQHAHYHICERHPDTVKPDMPVSTDVAPGKPESSHGEVPSETCTSSPSCCTSCSSNTQTTASLYPQLAYHQTLQRNLQLFCRPHSTGSATKMTGTAPTATHHSTRVRKPPTQLLEEMWPGPPLADEYFKHFSKLITSPTFHS